MVEVWFYMLHKKVLQRDRQIGNLLMCNDGSTTDDRKTITDRLHIREDMCIEKEGFSLRLELEHEILYELATHWIESTHRLIEEYELRIVEYCLCETNTLEHSLGVGIEFFRPSMLESYLGEYPIFTLSEFFF